MASGSINAVRLKAGTWPANWHCAKFGLVYQNRAQSSCRIHFSSEIADQLKICRWRLLRRKSRLCLIAACCVSIHLRLV